ncbi:50S ribosomal protein L9 [Elysia marginata]|uniref:Large ribosomal subunit protein bL9m n=1 Tax=Elysia marginata TaxID=1093978 RepID=A0AAV4EM02_9GAST|nr:50S ribosomal protein L9 [Elysia marginata]
MECILTDFVEGLGIRGDLVKVKRSVFHEELYPALLAVYASPENMAEFKEERKAKGIEKLESRLGVFARMAMKELNHLQLEVPMSTDQEWTLDKTHVQVAFRLQGVELDQDCIVLPEEPVTDFGEFTLEVKVD